MERRQRLSPAQWEQLVGFFEKNPQVARGYARSTQARQQALQMWEQLAVLLSSDGEGVTKEVKSWTKFWNDYKCKLKKKVQDITADMERTGGGPPLREILTNIELRLLAVLGENFGGRLEGVAVDPFASLDMVPIQVLENVEVLLVDNQNNLVVNAAPSGDGPSSPPADQPPADQPPLSTHRSGPARQRRTRQRNRPLTAFDQAHKTLTNIEEKRAEAELINANSLAKIVNLMERAVTAQEELGRQVAGALNNMAENIKTLSEKWGPSVPKDA